MVQFRVKHDKNYTVVNNTICTDKRLSWRAKGIWLYAFSRMDNWTFFLSDLMKQSCDGRDSVKNGLKELEKFGYLVREQRNGENGKFQNMSYTFYEIPLDKPPLTEKPSTVKPPTAKRLLTSTDRELSTEREQQTEADAKASAVVPVVVSSDIQKKTDLLKKYDAPQSLIDSVSDLSLDHLTQACLAFEQYIKRHKPDNPVGCLRKAIACGWKPNVEKEDKIKKEKEKLTQNEITLDKNKSESYSLYITHHKSFNENFSFEINDKMITLRQNKGFFPLSLLEENCIDILKSYIKNKIKN
jgi:hypothetical protein